MKNASRFLLSLVLLCGLFLTAPAQTIRSSSYQTVAHIKSDGTIQEVKACRKADQPLSYTALRRMTQSLNSIEKQQLTDYIITTYQYIDYPLALAYFGDWEGMISAMHHSKGSEFELKEEFVGWDDKVYAQMSQILVKEYGLADVHDFLAWPEKERVAASTLLKAQTDATLKQIAKYLRLLPWHASR